MEEKPEYEEFNVKLVKYSEPILVKKDSKIDQQKETEEDIKRKCANRAAENDDSNKNNPMGDYLFLLDYVFPPEEWEENGNTWRRTASTKPATREDVINLEKELFSQMTYWKARTKGLCPIRRELFSQCFDELIRQVCIINVDRGELLIRIRDDFKTTIEVYKQLFEDGLMFSTRKSAVIDQGTDKLHDLVNTLEEKQSLLKKKLYDVNLHLKNLNSISSEEIDALKIANNNEIDFFSKNHESLKIQTEALLSYKK